MTPAVLASPLERFALKLEVEAFLTYEARLLDEWRLGEWTGLLAEDVRYLVPPLGLPDADFRTTMFLVSDTYATLVSRTKQLLSASMWAEDPRSKSRRLVTNVEVLSEDGGKVEIGANFAVWTFQGDYSATYVGRYRHTLIRAKNSSFIFQERKAILDMETLRPHNKLTLII